jgi:hypothetical protein
MCCAKFPAIDFKKANGKLRAISFIRFGFFPYVNLVTPRVIAALRPAVNDRLYCRA